MKKYICSVNLREIIKANSKEEAMGLFMDNHECEDFCPDCKEYRKKKK